ncbi:glycosyltransferase family 2 protein [Rhizobium sp. Leaf262]|uniref:glycosyltransferase family 2 protein n=1 Tax=Rhizobium sp. Leaf262 TaxID=1736312 RepID=UPI0009E7252D|nr:glycosyltransferase family 2 protein [Rhizobium sp. Leaf262]
MTISVILPTYNRGATLLAAINSVITQSYSDLELIVVDDGSTEDVESIVCGISDSRVKYVKRQQNGGAAAARNTGLEHASGDYIAFQDSDDLWLPGKLQKQLALFSTMPSHIGVVVGAKILYGRDDDWNFGPGRVAYAPRPEGRLRLDEDQLGHLLTENRISLQNALFRKSCFPTVKWFDSCARANEDWGFAIQLAKFTTIYEDIEPVVLGFISQDSISMNRRKQMIGLMRILRHNREALSVRRKQRSVMLMDVGSYLFNVGKRRSAMTFLLAALIDHPSHIGLMSWAFVRKIFRHRHRTVLKASTPAPNVYSSELVAHAKIKTVY